LTEIAILFVSQFGKAGAYYFANYWVLGKHRWKPTLQLSDFTLWLLYNQGIHWTILLFCPFFVVISPIINVAAFMLFYYVTKNFYSKSATQNADDIGYFLMVLLNFTFFLIQLFYGVWFTISQEHSCGPILTGSYGWAPVEERLHESSVTDTLYNLITYYPLLWNLILLITVFGYFNRNEASVVKQYMEQEKAESRKLVDEQARQLGRLKRKLDLHKESLGMKHI
jgi:hypothetical protein